jgi:chromosome segregation ATPase
MHISRYRSEHRKVQHYATKLHKHKSISAELKKLCMTCSSLEAKVQEEKGHISHIAALLEQQINKLRNELKKSHAKTRIAHHMQKHLKGCITKLKTEAKLERPPLVKKLLQKGVYTSQAHEIARLLAKSGCAEQKIGGVITSVGKFLGVDMKGNMSQHTVQRAVLEGGIAADVQLGFEMSRVDCEF